MASVQGYTGEGRNPFRKVVALAPLAVPLLISSVRAQRMAISMKPRALPAEPGHNCGPDLPAGILLLLIVGVMFVAVILLKQRNLASISKIL